MQIKMVSSIGRAALMDGPKPQIRESDFGTFFRFLGVLLLRGGANAERRFGFEPLDLMPSVWQRG